jgi:hypothetical protein
LFRPSIAVQAVCGKYRAVGPLAHPGTKLAAARIAEKRRDRDRAISMGLGYLHMILKFPEPYAELPNAESACPLGSVGSGCLISRWIPDRYKLGNRHIPQTPPHRLNISGGTVLEAGFLKTEPWPSDWARQSAGLASLVMRPVISLGYASLTFCPVLALS